LDDSTPFINTSPVKLSPEQLKLADFLSRHIYAVGLQQRQTQRNSPEILQHQQHLWVTETLKALIALGYCLEAQDGDRALNASLTEQNLSLLVQGLQSSAGLSLSSLLDLRREAIRLRPCNVEFYRVMGDGILQLGEPLMAYDILAEGLKYYPTDIRLQQLTALALARSGSTVSANALLLKLAETHAPDEETLGLLARTHKDLWLQASDPDMRQHHLILAAQYYFQAYQLSDSLWAGINAATLTRIMGQLDQARTLAAQLQALCQQKLPPREEQTGANYWVLATLGEAALILDDWVAAEDFYRRAIALGQGRFGDISSSRRNALLLVDHLGGDRAQIQSWFQIPRVVVFCGHMLDRPGRSLPRFPAHLEGVVYEAIRDRLMALDARLGYASAACGSDILFLEAIRELGGEMHIMLPCERQQFIQDSVNILPGTNWIVRFEELLDQATEVVTASDHKLQQNDVVYEYSNRLLHGLAKMRAEQLSTDLVPLAVWNGEPGDGPGGTASTITLWKQWTDHIEVIDLKALVQQHPLVLPTALSTGVDRGGAAVLEDGEDPFMGPPYERQIRALLFADVVHYSHLHDEQYLPFVQHFLGAIADLAAQFPYHPLFKNTWGDALYFVFSTVRQAGRFALDLCDLIQSIAWETRHLPPDLNLRIALHAGPVERNIDPITGQINYIGTHVNHTARIEPITPPGKVYASQAFAAIATSEGVQEFTCDYVGQMPWAKHYGTFPTYHVRRRQ